jgi:hypothetical protein
MIVCFKCSRHTKVLLDSILDCEQYSDYSEVIASAVENLAMLQQELSSTDALVVQADGRARTIFESSVRTNKPLPDSGEDYGSEQEVSSHMLGASGGVLSHSGKIPDLFLLGGKASSSLPTIHQSTDVWIKGQHVPLERWIFGQYNKLLPAKVSCRALANLSYGQKSGIPLQEAAEQISKEAAVLGQVLARLDKQRGAVRSEAFSTAFPSSAERNAEKSRSRYANQFVAAISKQGQVSGLLIDLKLVNYKERRPHRLLLTEAGKHFALLRNPVLDNDEPGNTSKFSLGEIQFLLNHISSAVPVEDFAYRSILAAIKEGADSPNEIDRALQKYVSPEKRRALSKSFLSSQRSGAISRMEDLGLVIRVREGVRVSYSVTEAGEHYMRSE